MMTGGSERTHSELGAGDRKTAQPRVRSRPSCGLTAGLLALRLLPCPTPSSDDAECWSCGAVVESAQTAREHWKRAEGQDARGTPHNERGYVRYPLSQDVVLVEPRGLAEELLGEEVLKKMLGAPCWSLARGV
jgi:hypothetical protein